VQIAVHVRRGDLSLPDRLTARGRAQPDRLNPFSEGRWLPDEYYLRELPRVVAAAAKTGSRVEVHIMSEGLAAWAPLQPRYEAALMAAGAAAVHFHLESKQLYETLSHLIEADVLMLAPSSFSLVASAYSLGVQLMPHSEWLEMTERRHRHSAHLFPHQHILPRVPVCSCYDASLNESLRTRRTSYVPKDLEVATGPQAAHKCVLRCWDSAAEQKFLRTGPSFWRLNASASEKRTCTCSSTAGSSCLMRRFASETFACDVAALLAVKRSTRPSEVSDEATGWRPLWSPRLEVPTAVVARSP